MNIFKKITLSMAITAIFTIVSAPTFAAEEHVDKNAAVKTAAEGTIAKVNEAIALADKGDKAAFIAAISDARQLQKEFRYEQTELLRQKLNGKLRVARESADNGNMTEAGNSVKDSAVILKEMKTIYDAAHK